MPHRQTDKRASLTACRWNDVKDTFVTQNSALATIIESCHPGDEASFYRIRYPYGEPIFDKGEFHIPNQEGQIVPVSDPSVDESIREALGYNPLPVAMVSEKAIEHFNETPSRVMPFRLLKQGQLLGHWYLPEHRDQHHNDSLWQLCSGVRSLFMLPKITDTNSHKRLERTFALMGSKPKGLLDQWQVFRNIAKHPEFKSDWACEIIVLDKSWFDKHNAKAQALLNYLMQLAWKQSDFWRHQYQWDMAFSQLQSRRNLKPNPYLVDTAKHLFAMACGEVPGFQVAQDDTLAPTTELCEVYQNIYGMKQYAPIMMTLHDYDVNCPSDSVFYSLQLPTSLEYSPKSRNLSSTMHNLQELKHILEVMMDELTKSSMNNHNLGQIASRIKFEYFHSEIDQYNEIQHALELMKSDSFSAISARYPGQGLSENSPFLRGCIRISPVER